MTHVFIFGCGEVGRRVAAAWQARDAAISALTRGGASSEELAALAIRPLVGDLDAALPPLPTEGALVYYLAPPPRGGDTDPRIDRALAAMNHARPARLVYLSTTGVYGDCGGDWVDEERLPNPHASRARRRLYAEQAVTRWGEEHGVVTVRLRVAAIYGPGRLPRERIERRDPVLAESESPWTNRIHIDDLAAACVAAAERGLDGAVYNAADGHPSSMTDWFNRVADLLHLPRPPQLSLDEARKALGTAMLSYLAESRRLDNRRLREELGVVLRHPTLETGLPACLE